MKELPVPANVYFSDFAFSLCKYSVIRSGKTIANIEGLTNSENGHSYISFLYGADIQVGDILCNEFGEAVSVCKLEINTYRGTPELVNAFY